MFVTVLICTRNRAESLRRTLDSIFRGDNLRQSAWEVLVVETSNDHTPDICQEFQQRFPRHFRSIRETKLGKSNALNTGIREAKGDVLAFTDDDVLCEPDYIGNILETFSTTDADAAQGRVLLDCEGGWPKWLAGNCALMADYRDYGTEIADLEGTLCGTNMIVRADVFQRSGGFAPQLGPGGIGMWEDTEISLRMRKAGCRMIYAPKILMKHPWSQDRLTKSFIRERFFLQGRAIAYYEKLPTSVLRFALYVVKETILGETFALWCLCLGRPAEALNSQCEARSYAGLLWQNWLFNHGVRRELSVDLLSPCEAEVSK